MSGFLAKGAVEVLGLSGKARSGKDYLARQVVVPAGFLPFSLANHFKVSVLGKNGMGIIPPDALDIRQMWETDKDDAHRTALQEEGTERGRNVYGADLWTRHAEAWLYYFQLYGLRRFVITDVRFPDEVEWVRSLGGCVYRVEGRGGSIGARGAHISETALDTYSGFDRVIDNSPENAPWVLDEVKAALSQDFGATLNSLTTVGTP